MAVASGGVTVQFEHINQYMCFSTSLPARCMCLILSQAWSNLRATIEEGLNDEIPHRAHSP